MSERLQGPALLHAVRSRMARNYGASAGREAAFHAAKGDVFFLMCEVERMVAADGAAKMAEVAARRAEARENQQGETDGQES